MNVSIKNIQKIFNFNIWAIKSRSFLFFLNLLFNECFFFSSFHLESQLLPTGFWHGTIANISGESSDAKESAMYLLSHLILVTRIF